MKRLVIILAALVALATQAAEREIYNLSNDWRFFFKEDNTSDDAQFVSLPHMWNADALAGGGPYRQTMAEYERRLVVPDAWLSRRLFLKFYGVQSVADVFVNGTHVGAHRGGRTAFVCEITDAVVSGTNTLLVMVSNAYRNDVLPLSTEENIYGGIYRDVELIVTDRTAVSPLWYGSDGVFVRQLRADREKAEGVVDVMLTGAKDATCSLCVSIVDPDGYVASERVVKAKVDGKMVGVPYSIEHPSLWSPAKPDLYKVVVAVGDDTVRVTTGLRSVSVSPSEKLTINGKRVYVHGVVVPHDRAWVGSAVTPQHILSDLNLIEEMGANAIRSAEGPHGELLYNECDRRGMLAWIDLPFSQTQMLSDVAYLPTAEFERNGSDYLKEIIYQNYNHPSVVMWGIFSQLRGGSAVQLAYIRSLNALAKKSDPSRPTVACSLRDGEINRITDLVVWRQSIGWEHGSTRDVEAWQLALGRSWNFLSQGVCYGEGGEIGQYGETTTASVSQHRIPESRQARFHEEYAAQIDETLFWGVWLNTMFDFGSARYRTGVRNTGLVAFDHLSRKDAFYLYKTLWNTRETTLYIAGKNRPVRQSPRQVVRIYSSADRPTLTLGNDTIAVHQLSRGVYATDTLTLRGTSHFRATAAGKSDTFSLTVGNALKMRE